MSQGISSYLLSVLIVFTANVHAKNKEPIKAPKSKLAVEDILVNCKDISFEAVQEFMTGKSSRITLDNVQKSHPSLENVQKKDDSISLTVVFNHLMPGNRELCFAALAVVQVQPGKSSAEKCKVIGKPRIESLGDCRQEL